MHDKLAPSDHLAVYALRKALVKQLVLKIENYQTLRDHKIWCRELYTLLLFEQITGWSRFVWTKASSVLRGQNWLWHIIVVAIVIRLSSRHKRNFVQFPLVFIYCLVLIHIADGWIVSLDLFCYKQPRCQLQRQPKSCYFGPRKVLLLWLVQPNNRI